MIVIAEDRFKGYNDHFRRPTGDRVLKQLAPFLIIAVRVEDAVIRIGGDEFLILLHGKAAEATKEVVQPLPGGRRAAPVSFSLGRALRDGTEVMEQTIHPADLQLVRVGAQEHHHRRKRAHQVKTRYSHLLMRRTG